MSTITTTPVFIEKENVAKLHFPNTEVLVEAEKIALRKERLLRGAKLGNIDHIKCQIVFEDDQRLKYVSTTIWATMEKNISLKGGITIPINRIHDVVFLRTEGTKKF